MKNELSDATIIKYSSKYKKDLEKFMEGLQEYLVSVDYFKSLYCPEGYGKKYVKILLKKIKENYGVIFLAKSGSELVGCVAGIKYNLSAGEAIGYKKKINSARILELYLKPNFRGKKIGSLLMKTIENHFFGEKCDQIRVEVYAPNQHSHNFYQKQGYKNESIDLVKKLK